MNSEQATPDKSTSRPNLVIGIAWGLREEDLVLFATSLRRVSPETGIVLLTKNPTAGAQKLAARERIELVPLQSCYYGLGKSKPVRVRNFVGMKIARLLAKAAYPLLRIGYTRNQCVELWREMNKLVIQTAAGRFLEYRDFLKNRLLEYGKVMLTDVRDVYFQADPFASIPANELWLFEEPARVILGTESRNKRWVEVTFGRKVLKSIETHVVICAGITIGGIERVTGYLELMETELLRRNTVYPPDQGIHNVLARLGHFDRLGGVIVKNEAGPVLTMGFMKPDEIKIDAEGFVVDSLGRPYPILHQYDRHPSIVAAIQRREGASAAP